VLKQSAFAVHAARQLTLLVIASLALGCSLKDQLSLGKYHPAEFATDGSSTGGSGTNAGLDDPLANAGNAGAQGIVATSADGGPRDAAADSDAKMSASSDAGSVTPAPAPDAGANASSCREGMYLGDFSCTIDTIQSVAVLPMTATTQPTLTLRRSSQNVLQLAGSGLAFDFNGFRFAADLSGQLDCATNVFHADIVNGVFAAMAAPIPATFSGVVDGTYDRTKNALSGSWSFTDEGANGVCVGPWSAAFQP
jgi:hypothetical protein